jgi:isocitrate/isopropylmalate dehydrogenase
MIPGDGIGPEISQAVKDIFSASGVCIKNKITSPTTETDLKGEMQRSYLFFRFTHF